MTEKRTWFQRPFAAFFIIAGLAILSGYIILNSEGRREGGGEIGFGINYKHYGSDAREMETTVAIPLEDSLSAIQGIDRIMTMSENGRVRAYVTFRPNRRGDDYYDAVREAVQRVYETLPSSAQRPELNSSGDSRIPFWVAAVYGAADSGREALPDGALLERIVKPALNSIDGIGDVEISGPGIREIVIALDQEKTAALGLSPGRISAFLGSNDMLFHGGFLRYNGLDIPLRVDGRYADLASLREALIPLGQAAVPRGELVQLKAIADIYEQEREADTLTRLNGKKTAVISVTAASGADQGLLSRKINNEIGKFSSLPLEFRVLEDRGAVESKAFRSVIAAALEASLLVALAVVLLGMGKSAGLRNGLICAGAIPLVMVICAAFLSGAGFPVNRKFLAGLAVGVGSAIDAVILSAEGFGRAGNSGEGRTVLMKLWAPLVSGAVTTVAALIPLVGITAAGDITVIVYALGTVTLVSVALSLGLLPPLFLLEHKRRVMFPCRPVLPAALPIAVPVAIMVFLKRFRLGFSRLFAALLCFCLRRSPVFPAISLFVSIAAIAALAAAGADTAGEWAEDSVYAQIEFEGGFLKGEGDSLLAGWAEDMEKNPAVREVQTGARTGAGYGLVTFDPDKADVAGIRQLIRSGTIPGAYIYISEPSPGDRIWNIAVSGDDAEKCRELAKKAAALCSSLHLVKETVLNFKPGGKRLSLVPRRELLALGGIPFSSPADTVRRGVHGPVAYKRIRNGEETDLRIRFGSSLNSGNMLNGDDVLRIPLAALGNVPPYRIDSLMEAVTTEEVSRIQRENRRRTASLSIRTDPGDPRFFRDLTKEALKDLVLPPGYKIEFDPEAVRQAEALSGKLLNFIWAILFCYMIIAAAEESFILPLIILSAVPPSLAIPVLILVLSGAPVNSAAACALVAVSGLTVNASVISAGELWRRGSGKAMPVYCALRRRLPALLVTTVTTIMGALPFLFLKEANNVLVKTLAMVTVFGVGTSFFCSITLVPSLIHFYFRFREKNGRFRVAGT